MGQLFQTAEAFGEAEKYYKKAYEITKAKGIRMDRGVTLSHFADFYYHCSRPDEFATLVKEHDEFVKAGKRDYTKDPVHSMLYVDFTKVQLEKKVEFMKNVKQELSKGGFVINTALANNYIAGFYEDAGEYDEALKYIEENKILCRIDNNLNNLYVNTNAAYRILKKAGREKKRLLWPIIYSRLKTVSFVCSNAHW